MTMTQKDIQESVRGAYENAKRFLKDSKTLQEKGSLGHATSLAILGYEEAMKAYQLTKFHPFLSPFYSQDDLDLLKKRLFKSHNWKQHSALEYRISMEPILETIPEKERIELGLPSKSELQKGTEFAFSEKLDKMKNDGFYVDAFRIPSPWFPSDTNLTSVEFAQNLLKTQLKSVEIAVKGISQFDKFEPELLESKKDEVIEVVTMLEKAQAEDVTELEVLAKRMSKHGFAGKLIASLIRARISDDRFKITSKECRKK